MRYLIMNDFKSKVIAITAISSCSISLYVALRHLSFFYSKYQLTKKRTNKQNELKLDKEKFGRYLQQHPGDAKLEKQILCLSVIDLIKKLKTKELDHKQVLLAYQRKAFEVDKDLNCIVEFFYPNFADVNLDGPLAGLPFSIKDNLGYRGYDSCIGCSVFIGDPMPADCSPVTVIKQLGGVPFCKTVVPQTMMTVLSSNPIDGTVKNPVNLDRSPGGSSSGEAALITAGGSPLGLGTDIGGSIRLPAAWCGIQGFKPTSGRLTYLGFRSAGIQKTILAMWGPLSKDVEALVLFMHFFSGTELQYALDPSVPPIGFNSSLFCDDDKSIDYFPQSKRKMRIGYYCYDNWFKAVPACERVVMETKERLEKQGHELVKWEVPTQKDIFPFLHLYLEGIGNDGAEYIRKFLKYDSYGDSVSLAIVKLTGSRFTRILYGTMLRWFGDSDYSRFVLASLGFSNVNNLWLFGQKLAEHRRQFIDSWKEAGLDGVICPAVGCPAVPVHPKANFVGCLSYPFLYNALNFPAGTVSVGKVEQRDLDGMTDYPRNRSYWHRVIADMQDGTLGLPVSVQCVALPWRDETCLRLMLDVETAFKS